MRITLDTTFTDPRLALAGFSDNFNRPNGPVGSTPGGKVWEADSPTGTDMPLVVASNQAKRGTGGTASRTIWTVDSYLADGHFKFKVGNAGDHSFAVVVRALDANNNVIIQGRQSAESLVYAFQKRVAGTATTLASSGSVASAGGDEVEVVLDGPEITVVVNGSPLFGGSRNVPEFVSVTRHGILLQAGSSGNETLDNISMSRNP